MKSVQVVAVILVVVVCISAGPLPDSHLHTSLRTERPHLQQITERNTSRPDVPNTEMNPEGNSRRHDDPKTEEFHPLQNTQKNYTRESHQVQANFTGDAALNSTVNITGFMFVLPMDTRDTFQDIPMLSRSDCILSTCLTVNLGSALQHGDEKAGSATTDPFGVGKK